MIRSIDVEMAREVIEMKEVIKQNTESFSRTVLKKKAEEAPVLPCYAEINGKTVYLSASLRDSRQ